MTERKRRVIYLIGHLGLGGSEHQLFLLLSHMDKEQFEFHVVVFNPSNNYVFDEALEAMGVRVWSIPPTHTSILDRIRYLHTLFRDIQADVVHSWTFHDNPYAGIVGRLTGVPVRYGSLRNSLMLEGTRTLNPVFKFLAMYGVSRLFVNASSIAEELSDRRYPAKRIEVLPNGVEIERFDTVDPADLTPLGIGPEQRVVGMVANLRRVKGHLLFVEAMAQVLDRFDDVVGLIVGQPIPSEPDYPAEVRAAIEQSGHAGRIIMAGFRKDVPSIMKRMSVLCLTSHSEGMPNVVLEGMTAGCPVVATRVGGVVDLITHRETGMLADDASEIAERVTTLLQNRDLAAQICYNARQRVEQDYGCNQLAAQLMDMYHEAVQ